MSNTEQKLEQLLSELEEKGLKGRSSSKSHLKSALYDWRVEERWGDSNSVVLSCEDKGYAFIAFTRTEPRHCTLRHVFVIEDFRGEGIASKIMQMMYDEMAKRDVNILRFFADIPSVKFYERIGYTQWHGKSKTGLPFFYGRPSGELLELPKSQLRYVHESSGVSPNNILSLLYGDDDEA